MRLIDADALEKEMCSGCEYNKNKYANCDDCAIANAPTIDAEPIVRCKECMYFKEWIIDFTGDTVKLHACSYNNYGTNRDGYCNRGKRRKP